MPNNYVLLERIELNATATSVTFDNIPQTGYTDLKLVSSIRAFDNNEWITLAINGATTNISGRYLYGNGASASSGTIAAGGLLNPMVPSSWTANTFSNNEFYITNYASTTTPKTISVDGVAEYNNASADIMLSAVLWNSNSAITSVRIQTTSGTFAVGSTFSLYGVAKLGTTPAIAPKANGGNVIETDGTYWYHTFRTSGTFTPQVALSTDYLVVAGGGGGGSYGGGGGGAGGFRTGTGLSVAVQSYAITVGAGGAGGSGTSGASGNSSIFSSITSAGGGGGGGLSFGVPGIAGGSGGGTSAVNGGSSTGGAASPAGQGNAGGGATGGLSGGGGGGGAGAVGGAGSTSVAGNGGNGTASSYSGTSVTYAGGGGGASDPQSGGTGGTGGGGNGATNTAGGAGTVNLGGGGGGVWNPGGTGGAGGSGVVIIRYLVA
jgi:hypothetical protein